MHSKGATAAGAGAVGLGGGDGAGAAGASGGKLVKIKKKRNKAAMSDDGDETAKHLNILRKLLNEPSPEKARNMTINY